MPISRKVLMKCKNCGFTVYRTIGDKFPDKNHMKPCPKCKGNMEIVKDAKESDILDIVVGSIGSMLDMIKR